MSRFASQWLGVSLCMLCGLTFAQTNGSPAQEPFVGVIVPIRQIDVSSIVEGRLASLAVDLGDHVEAGHVLATLDPRLLRKELDARQAAVQVTEAELQRANARLHQAGERLERLKRAAEFVSQEQVRTAMEEREIAQTEARIAQAAVAQSQARMSAAAASLDDTTIRAPFDGTVANVYVSSGVVVRPGAPLLRLVGAKLRLRFAVPLESMSSVRLGTSVAVSSVKLGQPRSSYLAIVDGISPEVDLASRHVFVEALLQPSHELLSNVRAGQTVEVIVRAPTQ